MTIRHDKAALLAALSKPAITRHQLGEIIARSARTASTPRLPPRYVSLWRIYKETIALLADGMAVWPILGITGCLGSFEGWLHHFWTA